MKTLLTLLMLITLATVDLSAQYATYRGMKVERGYSTDTLTGLRIVSTKTAGLAAVQLIIGTDTTIIGTFADSLLIYSKSDEINIISGSNNPYITVGPQPDLGGLPFTGIRYFGTVDTGVNIVGDIGPLYGLPNETAGLFVDFTDSALVNNLTISPSATLFTAGADATDEATTLTVQHSALATRAYDPYINLTVTNNDGSQYATHFIDVSLDEGIQLSSKDSTGDALNFILSKVDGNASLTYTSPRNLADNEDGRLFEIRSKFKTDSTILTAGYAVGASVINTWADTDSNLANFYGLIVENLTDTGGAANSYGAIIGTDMSNGATNNNAYGVAVYSDTTGVTSRPTYFWGFTGYTVNGINADTSALLYYPQGLAASNRSYGILIEDTTVHNTLKSHLHIGRGTATSTSTSLDLNSTDGALLLNRLTTAQRDALTAVNGMAIYNTTNAEVEFYQGGGWGSGAGAYGQLSVTGGAATTTLNTSTYTKLKQFTTIDESSNIGISTTNDSIAVTSTGLYGIYYNGSVTTSTNNIVVKVAIHVNGAIANNGAIVSRKISTGADVGRGGTKIIKTLTAGDVIDIRAIVDVGTPTITITEGALVVRKL